MKTLIFVLLSLLMTGFVGTADAQYEHVPAENMFRTEEQRYGHLEHFGFYASAMGPWNFTEELAPATSLTWIHVGFDGDMERSLGRLLDRLHGAREAGVQAVLSIEPFLFANEAGDPRPEQDIVDFLVELRARIEAQGLLDSTAMLYPKDEPFREFVNARDPDFIEQYITGEVYEDVHEVLVYVNGLIKIAFPDKPVGVILSGYNLAHNFFSIPENYDWVGFNCYADLFRSCDDRSFIEHYIRLTDFMQPEQKLIAVPETWVQNENINRADWPDILRSRFRHHYEIALSEPRFVAFVPFIWSFDADRETPGLGLNRFPELFDDGVENRGTAFVEQVAEVGMEIKRGEHDYPNMSWEETEDSVYRPASRMRGGIMSITDSGMLSAWAINDALPHKNLRVQVILRSRDGRLLHKAAPERTFLRDPGLASGQFIGYRTIGLHGYRYQIPEQLLNAHAGQSLHVELAVFEDGKRRDLALIESVVFEGEQGLYPPPPNLDTELRRHLPAESTDSAASLGPVAADGREMAAIKAMRRR